MGPIKIIGGSPLLSYSRSASFPSYRSKVPPSIHPPPMQDLGYKGIVRVTYDRGYALQTKSLLLENTSTAFEAVEQLFEALGLRGSPKDYALEERNVVTGGKCVNVQCLVAQKILLNSIRIALSAFM